jgi:hypothetical protein
VLFDDVKLPWSTLLLDQLDPANPEDAEVRAIILRVQAKAAAWKPSPEMVRQIPQPVQASQTCEACGKPFEGRKDAKTCKPACRKRLSRQKPLDSGTRHAPLVQSDRNASLEA